MPKFVMVDTISMFRMRYVVEVPDDVENCTPEVYAMDSVTCEDTREYSQKHLDEVISSCREVTLQEAIDQYRLDNEYIKDWSDEQIVKSAITEVGFSRAEYEAEEEKRWKSGLV